MSISEQSTMYRLRRCDDKSDAEALHRLARDLAVFEKGLDSFETTADDFRRDGFETKPPLFHAVFAEHRASEEGEWRAVAFAVWFFSYSTWKGRCLYLEDLYVQPEHRRKGIAKRLYSFCVKQAADSGCKAVDYIVLKWNKHAVQMYESLGVTPRDNDGWHLMRMDSKCIQRFMTLHYTP